MPTLTEESHAIAAAGRTIQAVLYRPPAESSKPVPGILFLHEIFGVRGWVQEDARDLAHEGYAVLLPDLYSSMGAARYCIREFFTAAGISNDSRGHPALEEVFCALDYLETIPGVDSKRIGAIGQCLTGGFALHLARRPEVRAPVVYHHSLGLSGAGISRSDAAQIQNQIQGHYAETDPLFCPQRKQERLKSLLGERLDYRYHAGIGHGIRSRFRNTAEGRKAWEQTKEFFARNLSA